MSIALLNSLRLGTPSSGHLVATLSLIVVSLGLFATLVGGCDLLAGCRPIPPSSLPSGQPTGEPTYEVHGAKIAIWGVGSDRVELDVGLNQFVESRDERIDDVTIRGHRGLLFLHEDAGVVRPAVTWTERGCDYTLLLDPSTSVESAYTYAQRY